MIALEQCRIDDEGKHLIIEASVENLDYYDNVYIDSVIIDTDKTYSANGPSTKPVFSKTFDKEDARVITKCGCVSSVSDKDNSCESVYIPELGKKRIRLTLSGKDLKDTNLNDNIFFVYIVATGTPSPDTPCSMDNMYTMGVAVNMRPIYNMVMNYIKELDITCATPMGFIDMILRLKAFELSLKTGNYPVAFRHWNKLFKNKVNISPNKGCGCNGNN